MATPPLPQPTPPLPPPTPPLDQTVMLGETATFSCSAINVNDIIFEVDGTIDRSNWRSRGISQSEQHTSGSNTTVYLTVRGDARNNGINVSCSVFYVGATSFKDISPPARLTVQGTVNLAIFGACTSHSSVVPPPQPLPLLPNI